MEVKAINPKKIVNLIKLSDNDKHIIIPFSIFTQTRYLQRKPFHIHCMVCACVCSVVSEDSDRCVQYYNNVMYLYSNCSVIYFIVYLRCSASGLSQVSKCLHVFVCIHLNPHVCRIHTFYVTRPMYKLIFVTHSLTAAGVNILVSSLYKLSICGLSLSSSKLCKSIY